MRLHEDVSGEQVQMYVCPWNQVLEKKTFKACAYY